LSFVCVYVLVLFPFVIFVRAYFTSSLGAIEKLVNLLLLLLVVVVVVAAAAVVVVLLLSVVVVVVVYSGSRSKICPCARYASDD
jgi:hypothetical protein